MNNAEIADKLDGMKCMGATLTQDDAASDPWLSLCQDSYDREDVISFGIPEFVAFCRAVVERVDKTDRPCALCHKDRGKNLAICTPCKERISKVYNFKEAQDGMDK